MARPSRSTTSVQGGKGEYLPPVRVRGRKTKTTAPPSEEEVPETDQEDADDVYQDDEEDDVKSLHSDALDDDEDEVAPRGRKKGEKTASNSNGNLKRKRGAATTRSTKKSSPKKKRKKGSDDEDSDLELQEGQEIVGVVVQAPKTGRVPPGQISQNTFDFLMQLQKPECNDREWFKLHEPVYRVAEKEWKDFVDAFTPLLVDVDPQIPHLPPKDVIHRIYRDVRFSNDKTPYKTGFSASFSRSGRKGIFAHYHIAVRPGGDSIIAAGSWCPGKNELNTMRNNLLRSSRRLRSIISSPEFEKYFGEAKPRADGTRRNVFGGEDELKVAPKGVEKTHKDIDLLKCRSFAVVYKFSDEVVLSPDFKEELCKVARVMQPFVHCLNDLMTLPNADSSDSDSGDDGDDDDDEDGGDGDE